MKTEHLDKICQYGFKRLLLAVSGGMDSICLAHYFIKNKETLGLEWLGIAHIHHGLRIGTADRDAKFVEGFAKSHNIPFFLKKLDGELLKKADGSLEENAREARYLALMDVTLGVLRADRANNALDPITSARFQDDKGRCPDITKIVIVTAHHAGDQAETLLMRLQRGTTLAGLRGIQKIRSFNSVTLEAPRADRVHQALAPIASARLQDDTSSILLYRPFLHVTHKELIDYANENNLLWCEDESNSDVKFARNKVRHELLPKLEREYPGTTEQLSRIAGLANRAYGKVMDACEGVFGGIVLVDKELPDQVGDDIKNVESLITLNKKKLRKVLMAHENADLSEMFRLWLSEKGLRFPIGFFYDAKEPAHVKIPHHAVYRRRAIVKIGHTVQICEFSTPEEALNFVSCDKKDKGL